MESKKSIFSLFGSMFKSEAWYLSFPQVIQEFAERFASNDNSEKNLFQQTKKLLLRKYKKLKSNKEFANMFYKTVENEKKPVFDEEVFSKHLYAAIYEDDSILPNLIKIGDEEFLAKLFFEINEKPNSTDLKILIVSNPKCPVEVIRGALAFDQPAGLREVALLRDELSYPEKVRAFQDVLEGDSNLKLKNHFSQNLQPTVSDVPELMDLLAENVLNKNKLTSLCLQYERFIIKISGYSCKSDYATAELILENTVLFREETRNNDVVQVGTFKSRDGATSFLKKKFGSLPFVVHEFVVPESELPKEEEIPVEIEAVETTPGSEETTDKKSKGFKKNKKSEK